MVGLKEYLKESLLDDFDTLDNGIQDDIVSDILKKADDLSLKWGHHRVGVRTFSGAAPHAGTISKPSHIENGVLKLANIHEYVYTQQVHEQFEKLKQIEPYNTIYSSKRLVFEDIEKIDETVAKKIIIPNDVVIIGAGTNVIENVEFEVGGSGRVKGFLSVLSAMRSHSKKIFNNCKFNNRLSVSSHLSRMKFSDIPKFNNCKISNIHTIYIYDETSLKDRPDRFFEKLVDPSHIALYSLTPTPPPKNLRPDNWAETFGKNVKTTTKKGDFKQLYACLNNPKKYQFVPSEYGDTMFKINPKFKLEDLFDIKCFDNNLTRIQISDNNIGVIFYNKNTKKYFDLDLIAHKIGPENDLPLPNDKDWNVIICKKR